MKIPFIENIHQKVYQAVTSKENSLDMSTWHTCGTTHCWAGWITFLAGEDGKKLEEQTTTEFAAMQILYKSSPSIRVSPVRFYESNELAMANIEKCAKEEIEINKSK